MVREETLTHQLDLMQILQAQIVIHHHPTTHPQIFQEVHIIQFLHHLEDQLVEVLPLVEEARRLDPLAESDNESIIYFFNFLFTKYF